MEERLELPPEWAWRPKAHLARLWFHQDTSKKVVQDSQASVVLGFVEREERDKWVGLLRASHYNVESGDQGDHGWELIIHPCPMFRDGFIND
ncbi:MAG: hypothetical protein NTX87_15375 [Planctomycetota bacterium]|nr:hypothetical protein [Planctomycetota bacterium]